jgi:hypothetical protein
MADFVFTNAAGASAEKIRDSAANVGDHAAEGV